jgi:hypothetical protein
MKGRVVVGVVFCLYLCLCSSIWLLSSSCLAVWLWSTTSGIAWHSMASKALGVEAAIACIGNRYGYGFCMRFAWEAHDCKMDRWVA